MKAANYLGINSLLECCYCVIATELFISLDEESQNKYFQKLMVNENDLTEEAE